MHYGDLNARSGRVTRYRPGSMTSRGARELVRRVERDNDIRATREGLTWERP
jgi:hypothetical protein